jgi:hypothetical protein
MNASSQGTQRGWMQERIGGNFFSASFLENTIFSLIATAARFDTIFSTFDA